MRIHRTVHQRFFTTLGNEVLRDSRLSFCARGILGYLLSLPDGQSGDIRTLAGRTPEGRERVASAMRELERLGYMSRSLRHSATGQIYTLVEVFDTLGDASRPVTPKAGFTGSGGTDAVPDGDQPFKEQVKVTTLPRQTRAADGTVPGWAGVATEKIEDVGETRDIGQIEETGEIEDTVKSAAVLARVSRTEPRLNLGQFETLALAPLVTEWRRRGATDLHIISTLTAGLPGAVHSPAALVKDRLRRKMPAERAKVRTRAECAGCGAPLTVAGLCQHCRQPGAALSAQQGEALAACARGVALARAALRGAPSA